MGINTDYYYGIEAEQFSFYRMPKLLVTDKRFHSLSSDAKLLYGLMLDRMSLSMRNRWLDSKNRVYIIYTVEDIMCDLNCSNGKCAKILAELDSKKGIGLIERHRRGLGKPDIIYVKDFISKNTSNNEIGYCEVCDEEWEERNFFTDDKNENIESKEMQNSNLKKCENETSRDAKIASLEVQKLHTNKTNINKTDINKTNIDVYNTINLINQEEIQLKEKIPITTFGIKKQNHSKNSGSLSNTYTKNIQNKSQVCKTEVIESERDCCPCQNDADAENETDKAAIYIQRIRENIEYDIYRLDEKNGKYFDEIYTLMCDVVSSNCKSIPIGGVLYPQELVTARFLKLNAGHVMYVIYSITNVQTKIHNIRSYMITALYNAPCTMSHCYANDVNNLDINIKMKE